MRRSHRRALTAGIAVFAWLGLVGPAAAPLRAVAPLASGAPVSPVAPVASDEPGPRVVAVLSPSGSIARDVIGVDPSGPRDLFLWQRVEGRGPEIVGRVRSGADGSFAAEDVMISPRGGRILVSPSTGVAPGSFEAGGAVFEATARPHLVAWREGEQIVVGMAVRAQSVLLADARRREVARLAVPASPRRGAVWRADLEARVAFVAPEPVHGQPVAWQPLPIASSQEKRP